MTLTEFYNKVSPAVGVAQIVFNHLQKEFPVKKIKEVAETTSGGTPDRGNPEYWYGGKIPWIKSGETNDGLITAYEETITEKALANSSAKLFPKGTLLVAMYGATAGKTGILDFESTTNQALCAIFPGKLVERDYLFWFFRQRRFGYLQESFGGAQPNISQTLIKDTDLPVPDLETQRQVVSFLEKCEALGELDANFKFKNAFVEINKFFNYRSAYDDLTKSQSTQLTLLTALRQAILTEAVQGRLTARWRRDNPAPEHARELLHRIAAEKARLIREKKIGKEKPLPPVTEEEMPYALPEGWVWCRLGEVAEKLGAGSTPLGGKTGYVESGIKFFRSQNVYDWGLKLTDIAKIPLSVHEKMRGTHIAPKDLLLNITGASIGRCAVVPDDFDTGNVSQHVAIVRLVDTDLRYYIHSVIVSPYFQNLIMGVQVGVSREGLSMTSLRTLPIPLPPLPEQHAIVQKVNTLLAYCDELEQQVRQSRSDMDVLMQAVLEEVFGAGAGGRGTGQAHGA